jgi:nucleoside-diphosphate-sugar epimerase
MQPASNSTATSRTVVIAGASGLVGTAAALAFANAGWRVIAISRRLPELLEGQGITHLPLDLRDPVACAAAARQTRDATHVVYAAVFELPGLIKGWTDPLQIETNGQMLRNLIEPMRDGRLRHISILQGTKAYGGHVKPLRVPARESQPRVDHPNFYWLHEDYVRELAARDGTGWTIFRPQLIVGPNHGVVMNVPPVIGIYAALRKARGEPFSFPGGATWVWEAVDTRLVADALLWAADAPGARHETFNLTNGEVFSFRDLWPAMAKVLGVEAGPDEPLRLAEYIPAHESLWRNIQQRHGLRDIPLDALLGESHFYADVCFAFGASTSPPPTFVSTVKIRAAGFNRVFDTEASFCHWLRDLQRRRIIPPADPAP